MTNEDLQTEKSLLKCTLKKSAGVFAKVVLFLAYIIDAIAAGAIALYGLIGLSAVLIEPLLAAYQNIIAAICNVPWYVYVGIIALTAIPTYSFIWCVARELTDEDWSSDMAKSISTVMVLGLVLVLVLGLGLGLDETRTFLFIGAYLHYRKRTRSNK